MREVKERGREGKRLKKKGAVRMKRRWIRRNAGLRVGGERQTKKGGKRREAKKKIGNQERCKRDIEIERKERRKVRKRKKEKARNKK